jgi:diguanylate cyclase (GGDEF)-like protein
MKRFDHDQDLWQDMPLLLSNLKGSASGAVSDGIGVMTTAAPSKSDVRLYRLALLFASAFSATFGAWSLFKPANRAIFIDGNEALRLGGPLVLLALCVISWIVVRRSQSEKGPTSSEQRSWNWVALALMVSIAGFAVGRGISAYHEIGLNQILSSPSPADLGYLISYPFLLLAMLLLPNRTLSAASRTRILLDVLLVLMGLVAFSWYYVLGPTVMSQGGSMPAKIVIAAYPVWDLVLVGCVVLLWTLFREISQRRVTVLLTMAVLVLTVADSIREYQALHNEYVMGTVLDLGRPLSYILMGLAAIAALVVREQKGRQSETITSTPAPVGLLRGSPRVWRYLLPYASMPAVVALMIHVARLPDHPPLATGVYVAGALLIELVLLHQYLDYRELIAFANRNARLESLAAADPVTGLPNHRTVVLAFDVECERARRYQRHCTALFLDLDHFKALNDSYGHPAGDAALREFAAVVRTVLRGVDILGRWGGEEFIAMLPETDPDAALAVAERVRAAVAAHTFWSAGGAHLTCSIGVATYPNDAENRDELIEMADRAMYSAKRLGRNQVRTAGDPAVAALGDGVGFVGAREEAALVGTVEALAAMVEARDHATGKRVHDAAALAMRLALEMGLDTSEAHEVGLAGRLYDIGKIAVPDAILSKPGPLTDEESRVVQKHTVVGAMVISRIPALRALAPQVRAHHERWDGSGYPDGLAGEKIPLIARILAVADAYLAMTSDRSYRPAMPVDEALAEMDRESGRQFDPTIVDALKRVLELEVLSTGAIEVA